MPVTHHKLGDPAGKANAGPRLVNLIDQEECEREAREVAAKEAATAKLPIAVAAYDPRETELERLRSEVEDLRRSSLLASQALQRGDATMAAAALAGAEPPEGSPRPSLAASPDASPTGTSTSESRLRAVLTSRTSTSAELRQAIAAVEALLEQARRELAAKELRERRAAFEALHHAMDARSEERLPAAIAEARRTGCDEVDVEAAEAVLKDLQSLTTDQRQAKELRGLIASKQKEAFLCVKRDTPDQLVELLKGLPEGVRWQEWRDHAQRTLWRCSQDLRAEKVKAVLAPMLGLAEDVTKSGKRNRRKKNSLRKGSEASDGGGTPSSPASPETSFVMSGLPEEPARPAPSQASYSSMSPPSSPGGNSRRPRSPSSRLGGGAGQQMSAEDAFSRAFDIGSGWATSEAVSIPESPSSTYSPQKHVETDEEKIKKAKAFRAVANNDDESLQEVIDCTDVETMQRWLNKAGESLLVVAEKRKSSLFAMLAKAFGIAREQQRESYDEKQTVWVYTPGDAQPRQATVMEDTPMEADVVLLLFWDGDEPASYIDKHRVRPSWS